MDKTWIAEASDQQFKFSIADAGFARHVRALFTEYLAARADPDSDLYAAEVIFGELTANVVRHAPGPVSIRVCWEDRAAVLEVEDSGPGYEPCTSFPGHESDSHRGLPIVAALGKKLRVDRCNGYTVTSVVLPVVLAASLGQINSIRTLGEPDTRARAAFAPPDEIIDALLAVASAHDPQLAIHMNSVAHLATRASQAIGLDEDAEIRCRLASRVHDIGLMTVSKNIIEWPADLDDSELELIRLHSERGEAILRAVPRLSHLAHIIRAHHEHVDGSGYPDGLIGEEIPLESRVLTIVDAFHTMTVPRLYRPILSASAACEELVRSGGSHFDADIVAAFVSTFGLERSRTWYTA